MNYLIVLILLLLTNYSYAGNYSLIVGQSKVEHAWQGPVNYTDFKRDMTTIGIGYIADSNLGGSILYNKAGNSNTLGKHSQLTLEMPYILSYNLSYKYNYKRFNVFVGLSWNLIPSATRNKLTGISDGDRDNDNGWFYGIGYKLTDDITLSYKLTSHSRITSGGYDEWTRSQGIFLTHTF